MAWAPPNLPLFKGAPTAADGSAPAASPASGALQSPMASPILGYLHALPVAGLAAAGTWPSAPIDQDARRDFANQPMSPDVRRISDRFDVVAPRPIAPPVRFMDPNPFFESPQDQPLSNPPARVEAAPQSLPPPSPLPWFARPIPASPPGVPISQTQPRSRRRSPYAVSPWSLGLNANSEASAATPSADVAPGPWWLSDFAAVPQEASHPSPPLLSKGSALERSGINVPDLLDAIITAESHGDTNAAPKSGNQTFIDTSKGPPYPSWSLIGKHDPQHPISSALGAGQFIDGTWLGDLINHQPDLIRADPWLDPAVRSDPRLLTLAQARAGGLMNMRTDYEMSRRATARLLEENAASLANANLPLTPRNLYLAHFLGSDQAKAVLRADPNAPAEQAVSHSTALHNPDLIRGKTVSGLLAEIDRKIRRPRQVPFR